MKTYNFKSFDELKNFLRTSTSNFPSLAYIVFKKYYKERAYEMNFEILFNNQAAVCSLIKTKIDESDFRKMKYILSKTHADEVNDLNKKAIVYQYNITSENSLKELYETCSNGLIDVQFSDFYA